MLLFTALMASSFAVPVVGGVFWRRATREGAAVGIVGGITAAFVWKGFGPESAHAVVPGFILSLVFWWG